MPIKITPSKSVDINLTEATDGEVVAVTLEDSQRLFLSVWIGGLDMKFLTFEPELFPPSLAQHIDTVSGEIYWTERCLILYRSQANPGEGHVDFLNRYFRRFPQVVQSRSTDGQRHENMIDIGETPYVELGYPADHISYRWQASSPIASIEISTKEEALSHMASLAIT